MTRKLLFASIGIFVVIVLIAIPFIYLLNMVDDSPYQEEEPEQILPDTSLPDTSSPSDIPVQEKPADTLPADNPPTGVEEDASEEIPVEYTDALNARYDTLLTEYGGQCGDGSCQAPEQCDICPRDCGCVVDYGESCHPEDDRSDARGCYSSSFKWDSSEPDE